MKKAVTIAMLLAGLSSSAFAADLGTRKPSPIIPIIPVFTWTGFYVGLNAGYAFDNTSRFTTFNGAGTANGAPGAGGVGAPIRPGVANVNSDGFTGGGQVGYNYQFGQSFAGGGLVLGVEADIAYTDVGRTSAFVVNGTTTLLNANLNYLGTVRGRVGYAFDRLLIYGTGGFAFGDVSTSANFLTAGIPSFYGRRTDTETGYAYGGGVEYAIPTDSFLSFVNFFKSSAVTIKAEYIHYDLGSRNQSVAATGAFGNTGAYTQRIRTDGDIIRGGINYKF